MYDTFKRLKGVLLGIKREGHATKHCGVSTGEKKRGMKTKNCRLSEDGQGRGRLR